MKLSNIKFKIRDSVLNSGNYRRESFIDELVVDKELTWFDLRNLCEDNLDYFLSNPKGYSHFIMHNFDETEFLIGVNFLSHTGVAYITKDCDLSLLQKNFFFVNSKPDYYECLTPNKGPVKSLFYNSIELADKVVRAKLLKHQLEAFKWWEGKQRKGLLALDMGLGKTFLGAYMCYKNLFSKSYKNIIIFSPAQVIPKWKQELENLGSPCLHLASPGSEALVSEYIPTLISYEAVRLKRGEDISKSKRKLNLCDLTRDFSKLKFDLIICDESHFLNSHKSLNYRLLKQLISEKVHVVFLTGTPFSNGLQDSFSQSCLLNPNLVGKNVSEFRRNFLMDISPSDKFSKWVVRPEMEADLRKRIYHISYWKKLADGVVLPELGISDYPYELTKEQSDLIKQVKNKKVFPCEHEALPNGIPIVQATAAATIIRRICSGYASMDFKFPGIEDINIYEEFKHNPKMELLEYLLEKNAGKQTLIWINFIKSGNIVYNKLKDKYRIRLVNSETKAEDKELYVKQFLNGELDHIISHPKSLGTGRDFINATLQIYFELGYSLTEYEQSIKRSHRIGQKNDVQILRLIGKDSIEPMIKKALDTKTNIEKLLFDEYFNKEFVK